MFKFPFSCRVGKVGHQHILPFRQSKLATLCEKNQETYFSRRISTKIVRDFSRERDYSCLNIF
jgi:hypothetical protein